jgi:hypothetical protein
MERRQAAKLFQTENWCASDTLSTNMAKLHNVNSNSTKDKRKREALETLMIQNGLVNASLPNSVIFTIQKRTIKLPYVLSPGNRYPKFEKVTLSTKPFPCHYQKKNQRHKS